MENTYDQADNAGSVVRALLWLTAPRDAVAPRRMTVLAAAQDRTIAPVVGVSTPEVGSYAMSVIPTTIDRAVDLLCGLGADHKFSTRLGRSASPPV